MHAHFLIFFNSDYSPKSIHDLASKRPYPPCSSDLPTVVNIDDEVHKPPNLLDEFASVLLVSSFLLCFDSSIHDDTEERGLTILSSTV